jgi:hypothetical protein
VFLFVCGWCSEQISARDSAVHERGLESNKLVERIGTLQQQLQSMELAQKELERKVVKHRDIEKDAEKD